MRDASWSSRSSHAYDASRKKKLALVRCTQQKPLEVVVVIETVRELVGQAVVVLGNNLKGPGASEERLVLEAAHSYAVLAGHGVLGDGDIVVALCIKQNKNRHQNNAEQSTGWERTSSTLT